MFFKVHWPAFILAFSIGILYVYLFTPSPVVVLKRSISMNLREIVISIRSRPYLANERVNATPFYL